MKKMINYILAIGLSFCLAYLAQHPVLKNGVVLSDGFIKLFKVLAVFPMALVSGLRYYVGTDYGSYVYLFNNIETTKIKFLFIYNTILRFFTTNPQLFFITTSFLVTGLFFFCCYQESDNWGLSVLMYAGIEDFFVSMNVVRQFMAISLLWCAVVNLRKNQYIWFVIIVIIASFIHTSSILFLAIGVLYAFKNKPKKGIIIIVILSALSYVLLPVLIWFIKTYTEYGYYFDSMYVVNRFGSTLPLIIIYMTMFMVTVFAKKQKTDEKTWLYISGCLINITILLLSFRLPSNTYRLTYLFNGLITIYYPSVLNRIDNYKMRNFIMYSSIILFYIWTFLLITHNNQNVLPYSFIIESF